LQENLSTIQLRSDGVLRFFGQYEPTMMRVQPCCQAARYCIVVCLSFLFLFAQPHLAAQGPASDAADFQELSEKANRAREEGKSEQAIADYSRALKIRPDWPDGWWYLGTLHADQGNYSEAIVSFTNLVKLKPNFGPGWASLGLCEFETKDYQQSRLNLQKARELGFADVPALEKAATYHLALLLIQQGDFENAWEFLSARLGKGPLASQTKTALGLALLRVALLPDQIDPSKDALLDAAGGTAALLVNGNFERAIESFQRMEKKYPDTPFLHYAYGSALMFQSRYGDAETQLREETRITPNSALPYVRLAIIALKTNHAAKALPDATRATQLAPSSAIAHEILGRVLSEIGKPQEAAKEAETAAQLKPERPQVNEEVARLYALRTGQGEIRAGNCARTVTGAKDAIGIDRKLPEPWVVLALCEFEGKDYQNAYLHLERARELGYHGNAQEMTVAVTRLAQLRNLNGDFYGAAELLIPEARRGRLTDDMKGVLGLALLRLPVLQIDVLPANQPLIRDAGEAAALLHASKYDEAMRALDEMSKRYPKTPFLHLAYAEALETLSRYDDAETQLNLELSITPDNPLVHMRRAAIAVKLYRFEQALDAARKAVEADAGSAGGHELMGRALLELGRVDEATKELEIASKLAPDYPEVHYHLARAYTRAKLNSKAQQERAIFAELNDAIDRQKSSQAQAYGVPQVAAEPTVLSPR